MHSAYTSQTTYLLYALMRIPLQYTLYTVHCTMYKVHYKLYTVSTLYSVHCTMYIVLGTLTDAEVVGSNHLHDNHTQNTTRQVERGTDILQHLRVQTCYIITKPVEVRGKTTGAQNEAALSYRSVRGLYFLAVVFATTILFILLLTALF